MAYLKIQADLLVTLCWILAQQFSVCDASVISWISSMDEAKKKKTKNDKQNDFPGLKISMRYHTLSYW